MLSEIAHNVRGPHEKRPWKATRHEAGKAVSPEFFRQGVATALMSHVLSLATNRDVVVQTARLNVPAISLYRGFNFTETETREGRDGIVLVSLIKKRTLAQL